MRELGVTDADLRKLSVRFQAADTEAARGTLAGAADDVCRELGIRGAAAKDYLARTAAGLAPRAALAAESGSLKNVFLSLAQT